MELMSVVDYSPQHAYCSAKSFINHIITLVFENLSENTIVAGHVERTKTWSR